MTTGETDPSMNKVGPADSGTKPFRGFGFVEFMTEEDVETLRQQLKPVLAGPIMLDILAPGDQPWGDIDKAIDLGVLDGGQEDQSDTPNDYELNPYLVKSDMSAADVAAAIERIVRPPYDATAVREGLRLDIDILPPTDPS